MVRDTSFMFLTGPEVIHAVTGRSVTAQELGGAEAHSTLSGVTHLVADDERAALGLVKVLLGYLPQNNNDDPPRVAPSDPPDRMDPELNGLVPRDERVAYDIRPVLERIVDRDSLLELQPYWARNALIGFARLDGFPVGIVANQPAHLAGALDIDASDKISRFIRICDAYNVPILTFVDTPGFLPGVEQEYGGVIRHGAKIIYGYAAATVPKISVVVRKAIGGAYVAMSSKQLRCDLNFAWPTAQIAVMGPEGAVRILRRREIERAADPATAERAFVDAYRSAFFSPYRAADLGQVDEVIEPRETRPRLIRALEVLRTKVQPGPPRKHGLIPS
jgi:acetyl-CoA carboxylase carboxyltransferase component